VPSQSGIYRRSDTQRLVPSAGSAAVALVGDIGTTHPQTDVLAQAIADRLADSPGAPVLVLGDVFYRDGLLGACPDAGEPPRSIRGCSGARSPEEQFAAVFGPYRKRLPDRPIVAVAGNHDHYGDPESTDNTCQLTPVFAPDWQYLSAGCGLDPPDAVEVLDLGRMVVFILDTERMIQDGDYREAAAASLKEEVTRYRDSRPEAWRVVATHHPLESYGSHNGGRLGTGIRKDLYAVERTALLPLSLAVNYTYLRGVGHQDLYQGRYRAFRRVLYRTLEEAPVDVVVSGHDHSLQLVRIDHPGAPYQVVSGAGAYLSPYKRFGQDLLFLNRLARLVGLGGIVPAQGHKLLFAAGPDVGLGFAALAPESDRLVVEFYQADLPEPLYSYDIER
jgi:hypothetical protein